MENGPSFASAASQSTLNQRDSGQKCFTLQVSEVGSFGVSRRGISIHITDRPVRNRGVSASRGRQKTSFTVSRHGISRPGKWAEFPLALPSKDLVFESFRETFFIQNVSEVVAFESHTTQNSVLFLVGPVPNRGRFATSRIKTASSRISTAKTTKMHTHTMA